MECFCRYLLLSNLPPCLLSKSALSAWHARLTGLSEEEVGIEFIPPLASQSLPAEPASSVQCQAEESGEDAKKRPLQVRAEDSEGAEAEGEAKLQQPPSSPSPKSASPSREESREGTPEGGTESAAVSKVAVEKNAEAEDPTPDEGVSTKPSVDGHSVKEEAESRSAEGRTGEQEGSSAAQNSEGEPGVLQQQHSAHLTYRVKKAAVASLRALQNNDLNVKAEFAGPRRATTVLWIGNWRGAPLPLPSSFSAFARSWAAARRCGCWREGRV